MKIAYIITGLGLGGAEAITIDIANHVFRAGNKVIILYLTGENANKHRIDSQIEVVGFGMRKTPEGFIKTFLKARAVMNAFHPDIIHAQMFHANIFARFLRITYHHPKLICTEHNKKIGRNFRMKIYRHTDALSNFNTNVSQEAVDYFIEKKAFKSVNSRAVYNGIDLSRFVPNLAARQTIRSQHGISENEFLFINVGRLTEAKDQRNLIQAFSSLFNAKLMIVGQGELLNDLKQFAKDKGVENTMIFAGVHQNVEDFYCAADCFVLSSAWEGFGIVLAEAMACALPVITTDAGGCREVIDNDEFVVPPRNNVLLAEKMRQIQMMSLPERQAIGTENRKKAKRFDIENIVAEWMDIYTLLLQKNQERAYQKK
jgi:glycosyltransferase involved in cell wall biosynthesis